MIVFIIFISVIFLLLIIFFLTKIQINIEKFEMQNLECVIKIIKNIKNKSYMDIFDVINFRIILRLKLLGITYFKLNLNNMDVKKIVTKAIIKDNMLKNYNYKKYINKKSKQNKLKEKIKSKISKIITINKADLFISIGVVEADITAIIVGMLNLILSWIYEKYYILDRKIFDNINKIKYQVIPKYNQDINLKLESDMIVNINMSKIFL